jgi:tetratricopeptide (TPR) repeat protein
VPTKADHLNERGRELAEAGQTAEAEAAYRQAIDADPRWSVPHYNLGLLFKYQGRWQESLVANRNAVERDGSDTDAWWNLGIASTALAEWAIARQAWFRCGVVVPDGEGAPRCDYGAVPLRLNPDADGEVVWGDRVDPARAILQNIPLPSSGYLWADLVLHDGATVGTRMLHGRQVGVFNVLQVLERSRFATFELRAEIGDTEDLILLSDIAADTGGAAEDWSTAVTILCRACSEGTPHHLHDTDARLSGLPCAVAALNEAQCDQILSEWQRRAPQVQILERRRAAPP